MTQEQHADLLPGRARDELVQRWLDLARPQLVGLPELKERLVRQNVVKSEPQVWTREPIEHALRARPLPFRDRDPSTQEVEVPQSFQMIEHLVAAVATDRARCRWVGIRRLPLLAGSTRRAPPAKRDRSADFPTRRLPQTATS